MSQNTSLTTATATNHQPTSKGTSLMLIKRIFSTLLIIGVIAISITSAPAQSTNRGAWGRGNSVTSPALALQDQAPRAPVAEIQATSHELETAAQVGLLDKKTALVGSWLVTLGIGNRVVASFTGDGIAIGSGQGDVSLAPDLPTLTSQQGAWNYVGGQQFAVTLMSVQYDVPTAEYRGLIKIHLLLTVNRPADDFSGTARVEIIDPAGNLVDTFSFPIDGTRIKVEPVN
jgi:hypothetical protein